jgi:hypothetical protein
MRSSKKRQFLLLRETEGRHLLKENGLEKIAGNKEGDKKL